MLTTFFSCFVSLLYPQVMKNLPVLTYKAFAIPFRSFFLLDLIFIYLTCVVGIRFFFLWRPNFFSIINWKLHTCHGTSVLYEASVCVCVSVKYLWILLCSGLFLSPHEDTTCLSCYSFRTSLNYTKIIDWLGEELLSFTYWNYICFFSLEFVKVAKLHQFIFSC